MSKKVVVPFPARPFRADGSISKWGERWLVKQSAVNLVEMWESAPWWRKLLWRAEKKLEPLFTTSRRDK